MTYSAIQKPVLSTTSTTTATSKTHTNKAKRPNTLSKSKTMPDYTMANTESPDADLLGEDVFISTGTDGLRLLLT